MRAQEIEIRGDEIKLTNSYLTDPYERQNYAHLKAAGKGFIKDGRGKILARHILEIPLDDAAMLRTKHDLDWIAFEECGDRVALRRLLARFPYWRVAEGGI